MPLMGYDSYEHIPLPDDTLVARFMGPTCWPHEPSYPGIYVLLQP